MASAPRSVPRTRRCPGTHRARDLPCGAGATRMQADLCTPPSLRHRALRERCLRRSAPTHTARLNAAPGRARSGAILSARLYKQARNAEAAPGGHRPAAQVSVPREHDGRARRAPASDAERPPSAVRPQGRVLAPCAETWLKARGRLPLSGLLGSSGCGCRRPGAPGGGSTRRTAPPGGQRRARRSRSRLPGLGGRPTDRALLGGSPVCGQDGRLRRPVSALRLAGGRLPRPIAKHPGWHRAPGRVRPWPCAESQGLKAVMPSTDRVTMEAFGWGRLVRRRRTSPLPRRPTWLLPGGSWDAGDRRT